MVGAHPVGVTVVGHAGNKNIVAHLKKKLAQFAELRRAVGQAVQKNNDLVGFFAVG